MSASEAERAFVWHVRGLFRRLIEALGKHIVSDREQTSSGNSDERANGERRHRLACPVLLARVSRIDVGV